MTTLESKTTRAEAGKTCSCGGKCKDCQPSAGKEQPDVRAAGNLATQRLAKSAGEQALGGAFGHVMGQEPRDAGAPDAGAPAAPAAPAPAVAGAGGLTINVVQAAQNLTTCGSAEYKVHWNAPAASNGWIIQHLSFNPIVFGSNGLPVAANNSPQEYWEGWEVKNGSVFVGAASGGSAHVADTFRTVSEGPGRQGVVLERGRVKFIPGYSLVSPPWGSVAAAGSLPAMTTAPAGWSDSGALTHDMLVSFNCTDPDATKHTQTVTTTP